MEPDSIAGITLEMYAEVTARAVRLNCSAADAAAMILGDHVTPEDWAVASAAWRAEMEGSEDTRARYTAHYARMRVAR